MNNTELLRKGLAVMAIAGLAWATPSMAQSQKAQPNWTPSTSDKPSSMPSTPSTSDRSGSMPSSSDQSGTNPSSPSTSGQYGTSSPSTSGSTSSSGSLAGDVKDVRGQIQRVEGNTITLADGTELQLPDNIQVQRDELKAGASVKASYEERAGQKFVTSIEVGPSTR